jgi:integrase/recombinase XerD
LRPVEVDTILAVPNRQTTRGRRDYSLLLFLLRSGARVSEAINVDIGDLCLTAPYQVLIHGKGSKDRVIPVADDLVTVLRALVEERRRRKCCHGPLFVNSRGERLTRFGVTHLVRRAVRQAKKQCTTLECRRVSPHSFRHTAAMRLLQSGVDLAVIRGWLGHVNIQTTHEYLEADVEMKREALAAAQITPEAPVRYSPPSGILALLER